MTIPPTQTLPIRVEHIRQASDAVPPSQAAEIASVTEASVPDEPAVLDEEEQPAELYPALQYAHQPYVPPSVPPKEKARVSPVSAESRGPTPPHLRVPTDGDDSSVPQRPRSALTVGSGSDGSHGRNSLPRLGIGSSASPVNGTPSPRLSARGFSANRHSPDHRPMSYVDLLSHVPYHQQTAPAPQLDNSFLRRAVGSNASLLKTSQTLEMYRANLKKTTEPEVQYEFAIFMIQTAMELPPDEPTGQGQPGQLSRSELIREARHVLQKLADRSYPFAQYYLADGFSSGLFNKGKPDYDRAFPLFLAASKHMHAESGFRAALCYEFGWGCRKDYLKAQQFYRASAARGHPGAACRLGVALIEGLLGLSGTREERREGIKWLKRAAENADGQYNSAPYELGKLHEHGFGDEIFKDEVYAAQLFTQSADLGHPEANLVMGKAYEHGLLKCPKDAALSIHFYNGAAQAGLPEAMMALCAWYLFGAEPVLPKDEGEAFEWAKRAADLGYAKAQYAVGYFKEIGIGCRQDTLDANVWYVKAADQGEERAKQRLAVIRDAASGGSGSGNGGDKQKSKKGLLGKLGL
ncbi:HCP-like protein [Trichodelitschia bisporula]|uniref:HCP-like protein n=1 Tax=Trichodelitschia bisporula TaxID=703511 RepID=A0A6G1I6L4_9PEZI|nr:HCP-like protein [Trichodelitschia bisporula]